MRVLYAGDGSVGTGARYLLGAFKASGISCVHLPSSKRLTLPIVDRRFDVFILSDFPRWHLSRKAEAAVAAQVRSGAGLLMAGGWGSFSAPYGKWEGSVVESLLPVRCLGRDDRVNVASGALIVRRQQHPIVRSISDEGWPTICGFNRVNPVRGSTVVLSAQPLINRQSRSPGRMARLEYAREGYPLLVIQDKQGIRSAAFATDVAPHWCGGLVDWGRRIVKITVTPSVRIEVGDTYVRFFSSLIRWLGRGR